MEPRAESVPDHLLQCILAVSLDLTVALARVDEGAVAARLRQAIDELGRLAGDLQLLALCGEDEPEPAAVARF